MARRRKWRSKDDKILRDLRKRRGENPESATTESERRRGSLNRNRKEVAPKVLSPHERSTEPDFRQEFKRMRARFGGSGRYNVYVMELKSSAIEITMQFPTDDRKISSARRSGSHLVERMTWFPTRDWGEVTGCVYVGYTSKSVRERFEKHREGGNLAAKVAKKKRCVCHPMGHLKCEAFSACCGFITEEFGIEGIDDVETAKKLESWVGWSLYLQGYYVWGPDYHQKVRFLGDPPFEEPPHEPVIKEWTSDDWA